MIAGAALAAVLLAAAAPEPAVAVRILSRFHPQAADVACGAERHRVEARGGELALDGAPAGSSVALPPRRWRVAVRGAQERLYRGSLTFAAEGEELSIVARLPLEEYVAGVVDSESVPGTPLEALEALAVVARSYALAVPARHGRGSLCDLAHCQVLSGRPPRRASRAAARATRGEVLRLPAGGIAEAVFHAACGGHTGDPRELFGGSRTGAAAVPDPACPRQPWRAELPFEVFARVVRERLAPRGAEVPLRSLSGLDLRIGAGGYVVQVAYQGLRFGGEAFARALDGALGFGAVRSSRFRIVEEQDRLILVGSGLGHGVGLCQAGAALRAASGETHRDILEHYFPLARLGRVSGREAPDASASPGSRRRGSARWPRPAPR